MAAEAELELDWLCEVVARHTPAFFLHPADNHMPCSVEFFLEHSELRQAGEGSSAGHQVVLPRGSLAPQLLLEAQQQKPPGSRLWLEVASEAYGGMEKAQLDNIPVYAHPKHVLAADGSIEALEITYITLYPYNGHYNVLLGLIQAGAHAGDIEHCTARVHPRTGSLLGMWYNAHRCRDGCWAEAHTVPRDPQTGRIAAYVALHGHGTYPQPGRVLRHFGLGNDLCSGSGPVWRPRTVVLLPHPHHEQVHAGLPPNRRKLLHVSSRGSQLSSAELECSCDGGTSSGGSGEGGSSSRVAAAVQPSGLPTVVRDEPCEWLGFRGDWGAAPAPINQGWFHRAECPVSRAPLLRLFGHFVKERESV